jgi:1-aminocyclopropane-1-carboxylate deaminase/D-cysteine desulfhydrase-like pyridoxal-dependent ACC family enzyme
LIEIKPSPIQKIEFLDRDIYIKRDDLTHKDFSGNKARKFYHFLKTNYPNIKKVISHGSAQSNAMYSLSVLAKLKGWKFDYYVDHIASYLKNNPHGNYQKALENGMKIYEGNYPDSFDDCELFIKEGGAMDEAKEGIEILANEINSEFKDKKIDIFLPSGTGTTAFYLQRYTDFKVYTTNVVGSSQYLNKQFLDLNKDEKRYPTILESSKKYHFAKLYREFYDIWIDLKDKTDIEFDLLYDPKGWITLKENIDIFENEILYIHQGGLLGNKSMIKRYRNRFKDLINY